MRDSRHNARILALQQLFEQTFHEQNLDDSLSESFNLEDLQEVDELQNFDQNLFDQIITNIPEQKAKLDDIITILAPEWPIDKIAAIDLQILRLAILEGFVLKITPEKVAIDEAIELAKEFSNDQSRKFISGVLGNLFENRDKYL